MTFHVAIPTQDIELSKQFYERLGFQLEREFDRPEFGMRIAQLSFGGSYLLELIFHPANQPTPALHVPEAMHIGIPVADLAKILEELRQSGVRVVRDITPGVTVKQLAFVEDPVGFVVELFEPK